MAKRNNTPRAQAEDTATVPRPPKPRRSTSTAGAPPSDALGVQDGVLGSEPTDDDIRRRAYERYLERGGEHGMDFEDWLAAERDLRSRTSEV
jgi:Protein of unknown function (DUF2934)